MAILVTGGAGYIGSHTCIELLNRGYDVLAVDNFVNSKPEAVRRVGEICQKPLPFVELDIRNREGLQRLFCEHKIEAVIHFAGLKAVGESVSMPLEYYENNLIGTLTLCEVMRAAGCKKMVFSSSATVYGLHNPVPFTEEMPTSATNPYGYTKVMIEQILRDLCVADPEWSAVLLRYFNPIGAHESGKLGETPAGIPNNIFPYLSQVAVGKLPKLYVYGDDYDTLDGTGVRDYIHVCDLAEGHVAALDYCEKHTGAQAINLGTGHGTSVFELRAAFEKAAGVPIPMEVTGRRPGDIATAYADTALARKLLGFTAKRNIEQMCTDGWNFIRQNPNGI